MGDDPAGDDPVGDDPAGYDPAGYEPEPHVRLLIRFGVVAALVMAAAFITASQFDAPFPTAPPPPPPARPSSPVP